MRQSAPGSLGWMNGGTIVDMDTVFLFCFVFYFDLFAPQLHILWPCIASFGEKKEKKIPVVSSTLCRGRRCKCLYIVQHLYKYLLSALSGGKKHRGILNCSIIFLCKNIIIMRGKYLKMNGKKIR